MTNDELIDLVREAAREAAREVLGAAVPQERLAYGEAEAAALLGLEKHVLREQRRLGRISFTRGPGRRILYTPTHLTEYLGRSETRVE